MTQKIYLQPMDMVINAIHDLAELQKGSSVISDTACGFISFRIEMYGVEWVYRFTITDIGRNRCSVAISIDGDPENKARMAAHEYALLDYMLIDRAQIELSHMEEEDRRILSSR